MKRILFFMLVLSLICGVGTAGATLIQVKFNSVDPATPAQITNPGLGTGFNTEAGYYVLDTDILGQVKSYCVDPSIAPTDFQTYDMIAIPSQQYAAAAYLLGQNYSAFQATEAQIAVWEVVWDWGSDSGGGITDAALSAGNFILNSINNSALTSGEISDIITMCNAAIAASGSFDTTFYRLLVSPVPTNTSGYFGVNYQDYVVKVVPEPLTLLLVGSGLIPFIRLRKKR